jgi:hypothetical protein
MGVSPLPFAGKSALVTCATHNIGAKIGFTLSLFLKAVFGVKKSRALITHFGIGRPRVQFCWSGLSGRQPEAIPTSGR